jgi:hypothetical protein
MRLAVASLIPRALPIAAVTSLTADSGPGQAPVVAMTSDVSNPTSTTPTTTSAGINRRQPIAVSTT